MLARLVLIVVIVVCGYLLLWPVPIDPVNWQAPPNPGYQGAFAQNDGLADIERLDITGLHGPEALAIGPDGNIYSSTHEGWIIRFDPRSQQTERWVNTDGRPLGVTFDQRGNLLIADAFRGLLSVSPTGDITVLSDSVNGQPIRYADDLDIAPDGKIYFSDASSKFGAQNIGDTYQASLLDLMEHGGHGSLLVYDPETQQTDVLLDGLNFANGVAVSPDGRFVLINETGHYRVLRYWLQGPRTGEHDILVDNLPGFPDNIEHGEDGRFWIGLVSPRSPAIDSLADKPFLRKVPQRLPASLRPAAQFYGHVIAIDESGEVLRSLQDPEGGYHTNTGAIEHDDWLYISSLQETHLGRLRLTDALQ